VVACVPGVSPVVLALGGLLGDARSPGEASGEDDVGGSECAGVKQEVDCAGLVIFVVGEDGSTPPDRGRSP
jgi:hypothetical protein